MSSYARRLKPRQETMDIDQGIPEFTSTFHLASQSSSIDDAAVRPVIEVPKDTEPIYVLQYGAFRELFDISVGKWKEKKQKSSTFPEALAKDMYLYFVREKGTHYFDSLKDNKEQMKLDKKLRAEIAVYLSSHIWGLGTTKQQLGVALSDVGKQKRKNEKQKTERKNKHHRCLKCLRAFKNATEKRRHETKYCSKRIRLAVVKTSGVQSTKDRAVRPDCKEKRVRKEKIRERKQLGRYEVSNPSGLRVEISYVKQRGVWAERSFKKGDVICGYDGELIKGRKNILKRQEYYDHLSEEECAAFNLGKCNPGSYMFEFSDGNTKYCVDAVKSTGIGRFVNHMRSAPNAKMELHKDSENNPWLAITALRPIEKAEEILYDYGINVPKKDKEFAWVHC